MQSKLFKAIFFSFGIICSFNLLGAQEMAKITGQVKDQTGAAVVGAGAELSGRGVGRETRQADRSGDFVFAHLAAGEYELTVTAHGFEPVTQTIVLANGEQLVREVLLHPATVNSTVRVEEHAPATVNSTSFDVHDAQRLVSRNTAELLSSTLGVELRANGELASIPMIHGLGDERVKIVVDGMTVSAACPNHMNPPLTYTSPEGASRITVIAGITPVSMGGDSLGGTVQVESATPVFAQTGESLHETGSADGFYRSNGAAYGGTVNEWIARRNFGIGYNGTWSNNGDYTDGSGHTVTSTYAQTTDHVFLLAARHGSDLFTLQAGFHHTPYEGFVGAQMDMIRNLAESANLHWRHTMAKGQIEARGFWQAESHNMNIGHDKSQMMMSMYMPMNTHGVDVGYSLRYESEISSGQTLRVGNELHRFTLNDAWPPVAGTAPYMGPNTFININNGHRTRLGSFAELASKWNSHWSTLMGLRNDTVWTSAGEVQGYSSMYQTDADNFNAANRAHTDPDFDATLLARYDAGSQATIEFGFARKQRAPNLYERYAWSYNWMASGMIGWFNDGNYYVGNTALKPEAGNSMMGTLILRHGGERPAELKVAPYFNYITDYIDVNQVATNNFGSMSNFAQLQFANHAARTYGGDLSATATLWSNEYGKGSVHLLGGWVHGDQLDNHTPLYQMMPLNARLSLSEELRGFEASAELVAVDRKNNVDPNRFEQQTPGYALFNLSAGYHRGFLSFSAAGENLVNRLYELPLGGVNFDDFMAGGWMGSIAPLTGRGRSGSVRLTARF